MGIDEENVRKVTFTLFFFHAKPEFCFKYNSLWFPQFDQSINLTILLSLNMKIPKLTITLTMQI